MSETIYKELITKTFRDNAIRSVVMIDDEYLRYDQLLSKLEGGQDCRTDSGILVTKKAANLHDFFRKEKKISCDIDNGVDFIDPDKIRKSDLIILDYELEKGDPTKSIRLIGQLQKNDHMNLVVLYTRAKQDDVWLRVASSLRNAKSLESIATTLKIDSMALRNCWDEETDFTDEPPTDWNDWISNADLSEYLLTSDLGEATNSKFGKKYKNNGKPFRQYACEKILKKRYPLTDAAIEHGFEIRGSNGDIKWIQSGNIFLVIHTKSVEDNPQEPSQLWASLTAGLQDWYPSYCQLLVSEIQNSLENDGLRFDPMFAGDIEGQAGWLSKMLDTSEDTDRGMVSNQLIHQLVDELKTKLSNKKELLEFHNNSIDALSTIKTSRNDLSIEQFSALHVKLKTTGKDFDQCMLHALNVNLCSIAFTGRHVTSGTLLAEVTDAEVDPKKWYLCVSPACDTVPRQVNGKLAKRLAPDRFLKLLVLSIFNLKTALQEATSGKNIFVLTDKKVRLALSVQNQNNIPEIEYALVHDHNNPNENILKDGVKASFLHRDANNPSYLKEAKLMPVCQLRDSYTARYQTIASHHMGRVGVDFFNMK